MTSIENCKDNLLSLKARRILSTGEGREDRHQFLGVPDKSRVSLPYKSAENQAVADEVVRVLRRYAGENDLKVVNERGLLIVEGPFAVFEDAAEADKGRIR